MPLQGNEFLFLISIDLFLACSLWTCFNVDNCQNCKLHLLTSNTPQNKTGPLILLQFVLFENVMLRWSCMKVLRDSSYKSLTTIIDHFSYRPLVIPLLLTFELHSHIAVIDASEVHSPCKNKMCLKTRKACICTLNVTFNNSSVQWFCFGIND